MHKHLHCAGILSTGRGERGVKEAGEGVVIFGEKAAPAAAAGAEKIAETDAERYEAVVWFETSLN